MVHLKFPEGVLTQFLIRQMALEKRHFLRQIKSGTCGFSGDFLVLADYGVAQFEWGVTVENILCPWANIFIARQEIFNSIIAFFSVTSLNYSKLFLKCNPEWFTERSIFIPITLPFIIKREHTQKAFAQPLWNRKLVIGVNKSVIFGHFRCSYWNFHRYVSAVCMEDVEILWRTGCSWGVELVHRSSEDIGVPVYSGMWSLELGRDALCWE